MVLLHPDFQIHPLSLLAHRRALHIPKAAYAVLVVLAGNPESRMSLTPNTEKNMTDQNVRIRVKRATFSAEGRPDTEARVLLEPDGSVSFSINLGEDNKVYITGPIKVDPNNLLPFTEGLQFVTDTLSAEVPGRLSPFVRGWTNVASDLVATNYPAIDTPGMVEALDENDDDYATEFIADKLARILIYAHNRGLPLAKLIEAKSKKKVH